MSRRDATAENALQIRIHVTDFPDALKSIKAHAKKSNLSLQQAVVKAWWFFMAHVELAEKKELKARI